MIKEHTVFFITIRISEQENWKSRFVWMIFLFSSEIGLP